MTIQLSVTLWTIINFVLTMLILNRFLFKPYHEILKKRQERVEGAKAQHEANEEKLALAYEEAKADAAKREEEGLANYKEAVLAAELDAEKELNAAEKKQREEIKGVEENLAKEKEELMAGLSSDVSEISKKLADRLSA